MVVHVEIHKLLEQLTDKLNPFEPTIMTELDDPRMDTYYMSVTEHCYIVLQGVCGTCEDISIYYAPVSRTFTTANGYWTYIQPDDECVFELELDDFNGSLDDLISLIIKHTYLHAKR